MFQSPAYSQKLFELRQFLNKLTFKIIESQQKSNKKLLMTNGQMAAYTIVYELCNSKPSLQQKMLDQFKSCLVTFIESYIHSCPVGTPRKFSLQFSNQVIQWYNKLWSKFMRFLLQVGKKVFVYLDRHYLAGMQSSSLFKEGVKVFEKNVCHERNMQFFQDCYFKQLREIREKKIIQSQKLLYFAQSLAVINPEFITKLSQRYIRQSSQFYLTVFIHNNQLSYSQYLNKILNLHWFQEILILKSICMNPLQQHMLFAEFKRNLVQNYTSIFLHHGLQPMFKTKNVDTMKVLHQLYKRYEGFQKIRQAYYDLLIQQGNQIIQNYIGGENQPKESQQLQRKLSQEKLSLIDTLYQFYKSHLSLLSQGFQKDNELLVTLNNATEKLIAKHDKFTEILYKYSSACRSKGIFILNKQKITLLLQKISSKDEFIALYETQLFKKIKNHQIIIDEEEQFVNYLNEMCGNQLTLRLLKKIKDYKEMQQINQQMTLSKHQQKIEGIQQKDTIINLTVLSLQLWQKMFVDQVTLNLTLPQILMSEWIKIQTAFIEKEGKRKLIPLPFESNLLISAHFNSHTISIKCHLIQAAVFTYLASRSYTSQEQLIMNLRLQKNILQSTLDILQTIPGLILKTSLGDYIINWNWFPTLEYKQTRIIDLIAKSPQATKHIAKNVKQDRQILVQAAIVKFVKKSKTSTFQQIAITVTKMIRLFKPQPSLIKASVQKLIKKGFIQETQNGLLQYVE